MLRKGLLLAFSIISSVYTYAQPGDFCDAVTTIINDAPEKFRNIRGKQGDPGIMAWESGIKVPGTIASRFIRSMGLFYEGALWQSKTKDGLQEAYEKQKKQLTDCLEPLGYQVSQQDNFTPGLSEYKKVIFMRDLPANANADNAPAHVALEVTFNKQVGYYTLVMFIFEH